MSKEAENVEVDSKENIVDTTTVDTTTDDTTSKEKNDDGQNTELPGTGLATTALDVKGNAELILRYDANKKMSVVIENVTANINGQEQNIGDDQTQASIYDMAKGNKSDVSKGGKKKGGVTKRRRNRQKKSKRVYKKKLHK